MKIAVDLHIHSALSPCAHEDMTPNNIVNMAVLKGLDAIAVTDHNSCNNVEAVMRVAGERIVVVPGMEVQTREEVHLLCYFYSLDNLKDFDKVIQRHLSSLQNIPEIFGHQYIMNHKDQIIGERTESLISSVNLSIDQVVEEVARQQGAVVPAHINRNSYSIISQLGFIPEELGFSMLEFSQNGEKIASCYYSIPRLYSSDAHRLGEILEREVFLEVNKLTISGIVDILSNSQ